MTGVLIGMAWLAYMTVGVLTSRAVMRRLLANQRTRPDMLEAVVALALAVIWPLTVVCWAVEATGHAIIAGLWHGEARR